MVNHLIRSKTRSQEIQRFLRIQLKEESINYTVTYYTAPNFNFLRVLSLCVYDEFMILFLKYSKIV